MRSIRVGLKDRAYRIFIGPRLLTRLGAHLKQAGFSDHTFVIVSQKPVWVYHGQNLQASLSKESLDSTLFLMPQAKSSEATKTQAVWSRLIRFLASKDGKGRPLALMAFGGGVVGDLTGFAAAVYRRGIPCIQVPTTLTAQVDSAIGGKTGVDLPEGKNLLGSIYQPRMVLSDVSTLSSLSERSWSDGFAEVIKYGVIRDGALFELLESSGLQALRSDEARLEKVIERCAKIKSAVVEADEYDKNGVRIILNFGHTAGHAIETASAYSRAYTHGEAVGIGMLAACDISRELGVLKDPDLTRRLEKVLLKFNLPVYHKGLSTENLVKAIAYDKKAVQKKNRFVLPVRMGKVLVVSDVPSAVIKAALEKRKG